MVGRWTRRDVLRAVPAVGTVGVAGCQDGGSGSDGGTGSNDIGGSGRSGGDGGDGETGTGSTSEWPMFHADRSNTGAVETPGPREKPEEAWKTDIPGEGQAKVYHRPVLGDGAVYVGGEKDGESAVYAVDAESGETQWHQSSIGVLWGTAAYDDGTVYAGTSDALAAMDPADGSIRWRVERSGGNISPTPADDQVYFTHVADVGGEEPSLVGGESADYNVFRPPAVTDDLVVSAGFGPTAYERPSLTTAWSNEDVGRIPGSPVVADGRVYIGDRAGQAYAYDLESGDQLWSSPTDGQIEVTPVRVGDVVSFAVNGQLLLGLDPETGDELWRAEDLGVIRGLAAMGDVLYPVGHNLTAIDATDGTVLWSVEFESPANAVAASDGRLYVKHGENAGNESGSLSAYEAP